MSITTFMTVVPTGVRLALAIAITVTITLIFMRMFRRQILRLAKEPEEVDGHLRLPMLLDVTGSVIGLTTMAFVFFTAFGLSNYWSTAKAAETATQSEAMEYATAKSYVNLLPDPAAKSAVLGALSTYRESVITIQQPLLEAADRRAAYAAQGQASLQLGTVIMTSRAADTAASPLWSDIDDAFNAMVDDGYERVRAIPGQVSIGFFALVFVLGILNLVLIATFRPTTFGKNVFLLAVAATVTAVMWFMVSEVSNPFNGGGAVKPAIEQYR